VADANVQQIGISNIGIVYIEAGEVSKEELAKEFSVIYKTNWPWQIRSLDQWTFLVKFPPHMLVEDVAGYPCFGLVKEGVTVNVEVWNEELEPIQESHEVWLQLRGVNPKWCKWNALSQFASVLGIFEEVDWHGAFKSLSEVVRIKIRCKDPFSIPDERIFGFGKKYYRIGIVAELPGEVNGDGEDPANPSDHGTEDANGTQGKNDMDTDQGGSAKSPPSGSS
jgi:hypothetical protein